MKDEILQTSLRQFLKFGIREVSIQKLIEPLGISTKTVYKHFKNKEHLLEEALYLFHEQQYKTLDNPSLELSAGCHLFDLWHRAIVVEINVNNIFFQDLHYYYPALGSKIETAIGKKYTRHFLKVIQSGIDNRAFRSDIIPGVVQQSIYVLYNAVARTGDFKNFRLSSYDVLLNTVALIIRGICNAGEAEKLDEYMKLKRSQSMRKKVSNI